MKRHDFEWKGQLASSYGILVEKQAEYIRPTQRLESIVIPGRSGTLTIGEGDFPVYDNVIHAPVCYLRPGYSAEAAGAFLRGAGRVVFGSMPDRSFQARLSNQIPFARLDEAGGYLTFSPIFDCQPGAYMIPAAADIVLGEAGFVTNPGSMESEPKLLVEASGAVRLTAGTSIMELDGGEGPWALVIDSELQDCFDSSMGALRNHWMGGEFPKLLPGANVISWTGDVTQVKITPRWRYL